MKYIFFSLLILVLFVMAAGFQLFIFTALFIFGSITLTDSFPEIRLAEFVLSSGIFSTACIAIVAFLWKLGSKPKRKIEVWK